MNDKNYKWWALAFLWIACFLQQGMRQIFSPMIPTIGQSFGVSSAALGGVMTAFTLAYGITVPFAGTAGDFISRKKIIIFSLLVFSTGVFAAGWCGGLIGILLCYGILNGFGQSFFYPSVTSILQQLHAENKATALSILQVAIYSGIVLFSFASGYIVETTNGNWSLPFKIFGIAGIVWAIALVKLLRDTKPAAVPLNSANKKPNFASAMKAVLSKPSAIFLAIGLGMQIYVDVAFKTWMPTHLTEVFPGITLRNAALNAVLWHYLGAFAGVMIGSRIADSLVRKRPGIRMEMNIFGLLIASPFIIWMGKTHDFASICWAMALFGFFRGIYDSNQFAAVFDVVSPRYRASAMGVILCFSFVFGSIAPAVLGWMKDNYGMQTGLLSLAGFFVFGALSISVARIFFLKKDLEV